VLLPSEHFDFETKLTIYVNVKGILLIRLKTSQRHLASQRDSECIAWHLKALKTRTQERRQKGASI